MLKKVILTIGVASTLILTTACGQTNTSPVKNNENQSVSSSENIKEKLTIKSSYFAYDNDKKLALKIKNAKLEFNDINNNTKYTGDVDKNGNIKCTSDDMTKIDCSVSDDIITITVNGTKYDLPITSEDRYVTYIQFIQKENQEEESVIIESSVITDSETSNESNYDTSDTSSMQSSSKSDPSQKLPESSSVISDTNSDTSENSKEPNDYTKYALGNYYSTSGDMKNIYDVSIVQNGNNILVTLGISPQFKHLDKFDNNTRFYASLPADYFVKRNIGKYWFKMDLSKNPRDEQKTVTLELGQDANSKIIGRITCGDYSEEITFERL